MPTEQRRHMPPFHLPPLGSESPFNDELRLRTEPQVGLLKRDQVGLVKQDCIPEHVDGFSLILGSKCFAPSPIEKLMPVRANVDRLDNMQSFKLMDQKITSGVEDKLLGQIRHVNLWPSSWRADQDSARQRESFPSPKPLALPLDGAQKKLNGIQCENGLFSSSVPDIFENKIRLTLKNGVSGELAEKINSNHADDEPFELPREIEVEIIGNLLPDDDDLLSGVLDDVGYTGRATYQDDIDDDIFYTGGGMELEADENNKVSEANGRSNNNQVRLDGQLNDEPTYGVPPSRTLHVKNIDSSVEDSELKLIFEQYGDIRALYTDCKHHGFVMISYYDVRSAVNALKGLQSKPLRCRKIYINYSAPKDYPLEKDINLGTVIVFNLDPSVSDDDLHRIFGGYGEIKEIAGNGHHKSIEFYDVRAAEAARHALNNGNIAGKKIELGRSCSGGTNCLMLQTSRELESEQIGVRELGSPNNTPSTCYGSIDMASITSTGPENGAVRILNSGVQSRTTKFNTSFPVGITSAGIQNYSTLAELNYSRGKMNVQTNVPMNYGFQDISPFSPHSLPEFQNGLSNSVPYNLSIMPTTGVKSDSRTSEAMDSRHIYKGGSGNLSTHSGHNEALVISRAGSCPLHNHQLPQSYSYNLHRQPSSPMLWPSSGPFTNNMPPPLAQVHGISRSPSRMPENILPLDYHHVGSAPAVNPPSWDRRHRYAGEIIDAPGFQPGSAGSMGFPSSPHLHELELNNMFPKTGGTLMDPMFPAHISTPHQRGHMFHGRSRMIPLPSSFGSPGERTRSRRSESCVNQSDNKRQYELDIERIVCGEDSRTTLMIKNIPNKYTSKMLLSAIDENHRGTYDFIYLPIDFKNKCNVGYAFINMINPEHIVPFYKAFNGKRWEKFNSEKVASLAYARIQGKSDLVAHFQNSSLMNEDKRCRPILFHSDGPNAGDQEPFPVGTNIRSRPGKSRISSWEENHQDAMLAPAKGGILPNRVGDNPSYIARETDPVA